MSPLPLISVVIPHLDHSGALSRCLGALATQQAGTPPFEVIVVDNGSHALPTAAVAAAPFARLEHEPTPGPGPARSRGAHLARGEILAFIDSDCIADPNWLATIAASFQANPELQVIGGHVRIAPATPGRLTGIEAYESIWGYRMKLYVERDLYTATCNMAVRRKTFAQVGDFGGIAIAEDMDWGRRASAQGARMAYVPDIRIATPARENFSELARKWDRHIAHDAEQIATPADRLRWIRRAVFLAASPLAELPRLFGTDVAQGARARALGCLIRIRLYRARRMLGLLWGRTDRTPATAWRRRN